MKKIILLFAFVLFLACTCTAAFAENAIDNINTPYYKIKLSIFENMPKTEGSIVFLGDSLTDYVKFDEIFPELKIKNRGIAGDTTIGVLNRIDEVLSLKPSKLFILIGTNDIVFNRKPDEIVANIKKIIETFREKSPGTVIYLQKLFPVNHDFEDKRRPPETILAINTRLEKLSQEMNVALIDTYSLFAENDKLPERYTVDGIHLNGAGILRWTEFLSTWLNEK